ncbi:hypothetical protein QEN19_003941 [Hanseniaspora menglaensis]
MNTKFADKNLESSEFLDLDKYVKLNKENESLHFYSKTIKTSQSFNNLINIEEKFIICCNEQGFLFIYDIRALRDVKLIKQQRFHFRILSILQLKQSDDPTIISFAICDEFNILVEYSYDLIRDEIKLCDGKYEFLKHIDIKNSGINLNTYMQFDHIEDDEVNKFVTFNSKSILLISREDTIYHYNSDSEFVLACKFLSDDTLLTIEDFNIAKVYQIDYVAGKLFLLDSIELSEYSIYSHITVLGNYFFEDDNSQRDQRRHSIKNYAFVNGSDGRLLLLENDRRSGLLKIVSNCKIPIPKSLVAENKKLGKNVLPMIVDFKKPKLSGGTGEFCLLLTHLGDLVNVRLIKSKEDEITIQFAQFNKLEPLIKFDIITSKGYLLTLPQFAIPKVYQINNLDTKIIDQNRFDDLDETLEYDSLSLISQLPNLFLKHPVLDAKIKKINSNNLTINMDNINSYNNGLKFVNKMTINVIDDSEKIIPDNIQTIMLNQQTKLIFLSYNLVNKTRILHFSANDEINEIDVSDKYNSGVFVLKEYTIKILRHLNYILQITKDKLNIIKMDGDKFTLVKRHFLKDLIPDILEYTVSLEFHGCQLISKKSLLIFSLSNYKFISLNFNDIMSDVMAVSNLVLPEIEPFNQWSILQTNNRNIILGLITNDNILQLYDLTNISDDDINEDAKISKYFNDKVTCFSMKIVDDFVSIHIGFDSGLYQVYSLNRNFNLELSFEKILTMEKILLHSIDNIIVISSGNTQWVSFVSNGYQMLKPIDGIDSLEILTSVIEFGNNLILETDSKYNQLSFYKNNKFLKYGQVGTIFLTNKGNIILGKFLFDDVSYFKEIEEIVNEDENEQSNEDKGDDEEQISEEEDDEEEEEDNDEIDVVTIFHEKVKQKHIYLYDSKENMYDIIINNESFQIKYDVPLHLKKNYQGQNFGFTESYSHSITSALLVEYTDKKLYDSSQLGKYLIFGTKKGVLLLFKVNNNPKSKELKQNKTEMSTELVETSNLSKSQKKRLKKKQNTVNSDNNIQQEEKDDYAYNYLSLISENILEDNRNAIIILSKFDDNKILTSLNASELVTLSLKNNSLIVITCTPTLPCLSTIQKIDIWNNKYVVAADTTGNLVFHKYLADIKKFIPIADYVLSKNYIQKLKIFDYKTIILSDRFGNLTTLAIDWNLSFDQFENIEDFQLSSLYYDFSNTDFSKNRKDNVWDAAFKFKKLNSMYIGDIVMDIEHIPSYSKLRNDRDILLCFGIQGSITVLIPLISDKEVEQLKSIDSILEKQNGGDGISKFRFESTFTLTKNIFNGDYYDTIESLDMELKQLLQLLKNSTYLE